MNSVPLAEHRRTSARTMGGLATGLLESARKVAQAGADFAILPGQHVPQAFST